MRTHTGIRILVAGWTVLWMAIAAPCAIAGAPDGANAGHSVGIHTTHIADSAPADDTGTASQLLCLHDCSQVA